MAVGPLLWLPTGNRTASERKVTGQCHNWRTAAGVSRDALARRQSEDFPLRPGAGPAAIILDGDRIELDTLAPRQLLAFLVVAAGSGDLVPLQLLECIRERLACTDDLLVRLVERSIESTLSLARISEVAGIGELALEAEPCHLLLARVLLIEALTVLAQMFGESLEIGQLATPLVELPAMQTDQAFERAHALGPSRICFSAAYPSAIEPCSSRRCDMNCSSAG